jgi:hypothetical protein
VEGDRRNQVQSTYMILLSAVSRKRGEFKFLVSKLLSYLYFVSKWKGKFATRKDSEGVFDGEQPTLQHIKSEVHIFIP